VAKRPNFLFFITDQHRVDYLGCYGHPYLATKNIDALAARGVRFERAFAQSGVCGPSRMSMYTGRYVSSHGVRSGGSPLAAVQHLRRCAARRRLATALVGKSHLQNFPICRRW
jgi:arylsulfatase A-like enzyme